jgi:hypothetical protein
MCKLIAHSLMEAAIEDNQNPASLALLKRAREAAFAMMRSSLAFSDDPEARETLEGFRRSIPVEGSTPHVQCLVACCSCYEHPILRVRYSTCSGERNVVCGLSAA